MFKWPSHLGAGSVLTRYGVAVVGVALAALLRWGLDPYLADTSQFIVFYLALTVAAMVGGPGPTLLTTLLGALVGIWIFVEPRGRLSWGDAPSVVRLVIFVGAGLATSVLSAWMHAAYRRAEEQTKEAQRHSARLKQSEERFRIVADKARAVFGIVQGNRFVYANPYLAEVSGYSIPEILGMDFVHLVHPEDRLQVSDYAQRRQLGQEVPSHYEFRMLSKDGQIRWMDFSAGQTEYQGRPAVVGTAYDITERKQAEDRLRASEARFRALVQAASQIVWTTDEQGATYEDSPSWRAFTGQSYAEWLGWGWLEAVHPEDRARTAAHWRECLQQKIPYEIDYRVRHHTGAYRWMQARAVPLLNPEGPANGWVGMSTDITERKQAEDHVLQSKQRLEQLIKGAPVGLAMFDRQMRYIRVSDRWLQDVGLHDRDAAWLVGRCHYEVFPNLPAHWKQAHQRGLAGEIVRGEEMWTAADGTPRFIRWVIHPWGDGGTRTGGIIIFVEDISERKRVEEDLASAKHAAEQAQIAAEEANRAKDHFLAVLSHELRNPLTPVTAAVALLRSKIGQDRDAQETLEMIDRNVEMEARLIDDLLDMTRIARGKIELFKKSVELCEIINRAVEVCTPDLEARSLHFRIDWGPRPYWVHADVGRLQQVFWNLLKNATKFTPQGGCVGVRCYRQNDQAITEVVDSGIGIEPEMLPRLFNAFEQAERTITRQFGGLGLGLTISKTLVELHGGRIEAQSAGKGRGALFRVFLPLTVPAGPATPPPAARSAGGEPAMPTTRKLRILLVEDHADTARVMQQLLKLEGHAVERAGDVATALEMTRRASFDLLISDLGLPDRSGLDLIRGLRARGATMPAIALSGYGQEEDIRRSQEAGFSAHLIKPASPEQLAQTIARVTA